MLLMPLAKHHSFGRRQGVYELPIHVNHLIISKIGNVEIVACLLKGGASTAFADNEQRTGFKLIDNNPFLLIYD